MIRNKSAKMKIEDPNIYNKSKSDVLIVSCDNLELKLRDFKESITSRSNWLNTLGIIITLVLALLTSQFKEFLWLDASVWKAIFILSLIIMCVKFCFDLRKMKEEISAQELIKTLKKK